MSDRGKHRFEPEFKRGRLKDSDYKKIGRLFGDKDYSRNWRKKDWRNEEEWDDDEYQR